MFTRVLYNSTYGDALFLAFETWFIAYLVLGYNFSQTSAILYSGIAGASIAYLLSPLAPMNLLWTLQASVMPIIATARVSVLYNVN